MQRFTKPPRRKPPRVRISPLPNFSSHSVAVSTSPFHGGSRGSSPLGSAILIRSSTIGSASEFGSEGYRFESYLRSFLGRCVVFFLECNKVLLQFAINKFIMRVRILANSGVS